MRYLLALTMVGLVGGGATAQTTDPVLAKLVAGAKAVPAAIISFERSSRTTARETNGATETSTRVDRWNGRTMQRISTDGRPATPQEIADLTKATKGRPIPGYHRIGDYLDAGARRLSEKPGQIIYRVDRMPKGSVDLNGDKSDRFSADIAVDTSGAAPVATRSHIFLQKPFSIMLVAKIDKFDVVNDYGIGKDGRPALLKSVQQMTGAQFGKVGEQRTESVYTTLN